MYRPHHTEDLLPYDRVLGLRGVSTSLAVLFQGICSLTNPVFMNDGRSLDELAIECHIFCGRVLIIQLQDQLCSRSVPRGERDAIVVTHARQIFINKIPSAVRFLVQQSVREDQRGYFLPLMGLHTPLLVLE